MAINTHQADHIEYIQDSNNNKHYLNAEYLDGHSYNDISTAIDGKADKSAIPTNYVTTNTNQTITGLKTFNAPASASGEQATATFKTANGGQIIFGKEGANSGSMIALDQVAGTRRLNFRASATAGAIVWEQPENNSCLYYDVKNVSFRNTAAVSFDGATSVKFSHFADAAALGTDSNGNLKKVTIPAAVSESTVSGWGFTKNKGTVTSVATADGITGGSITSSGTIKANLKSYTKNTAEIGGRLYGVELDKNGKLAVNVPWTDTNTDTHYTNYLQIKGNGTEAVKFTQNVDKTLNLKPGNNISISVASGEITISATDTNTHNSHIVYSGKKSDGTTDISSGTASSGNITLGDSGVTAGAYGDTAAQTPGYNATFKVPSISVNAKGIVTAIGEHTVKIPDNNNLVPYTGASKDVNLGNHSLSISDKTDTRGTMIKVSGKGINEDDVWTTIEPYGINMASPGISYAYLSSSELTISDGAQYGSVTENGFKAALKENDKDRQSSRYEYDGIRHNDKKLSFPAKAGTIALTSDLSTFLDKGTSSTVVNQVVYNPVEMKNKLTLPSLSSPKISLSGNDIPLFTLRGATSGNYNISKLVLSSYSIGATDTSTLSATKIEQGADSFTISYKSDNMMSTDFGFSPEFG